MIIAGFKKTSLVEWEGKICSIIFLGGCNLRCEFCYVPHLVEPRGFIEEKEIFSYLEKNKKFLDAVMISGGEPTINKELPEFIKKIKNFGLKIGIETNGTNFEMIKKLVENKLVDYVAMDIKTKLDFASYQNITKNLTKENFFNILNMIGFLLQNKVDYEFRTTLVKEFHKKEDIIEICKKISKAKIYYLQNYKNFGKTVSGKFFTPMPGKEIKEIIKEGRKFVNVQFRG